MAFSSDGKYVAGSTQGNELLIWEVAGRKLVADIDEGRASGWIERSCFLAFSSDSKGLFTASIAQDMAKLVARRRDPRTGGLLAQVELAPLVLTPPAPQYLRLFSPGGKALLGMAVKPRSEAGLGAIGIDPSEEDYGETLFVYDTSPLLGTSVPDDTNKDGAGPRVRNAEPREKSMEN